VDPTGEFIHYIAGGITVATITGAVVWGIDAYKQHKKCQAYRECEKQLQNQCDQGLPDRNNPQELADNCQRLKQECLGGLTELTERGSTIVEPASNLPSLPAPLPTK